MRSAQHDNTGLGQYHQLLGNKCRSKLKFFNLYYNTSIVWVVTTWWLVSWALDRAVWLEPKIKTSFILTLSAYTLKTISATPIFYYQIVNTTFNVTKKGRSGFIATLNFQKVKVAL